MKARDGKEMGMWKERKWKGRRFEYKLGHACHLHISHTMLFRMDRCCACGLRNICPIQLSEQQAVLAVAIMIIAIVIIVVVVLTKCTQYY